MGYKLFKIHVLVCVDIIPNNTLEMFWAEEGCGVSLYESRTNNMQTNQCGISIPFMCVQIALLWSSHDNSYIFVIYFLI